MVDLLHIAVDPRRRLPERLASGQLVRVSAVFDAMSARLVEHAGFSAVYVSGWGDPAAA